MAASFFKAVLIGLVAATTGAGPAAAQLLLPDPPVLQSFANTPTTSFGPTPTMRREKLKQVSALRAEAAQLRAANGGTLSPEHAAYIQRRAEEILGRRLSLDTGTLVPKP